MALRFSLTILALTLAVVAAVTLPPLQFRNTNIDDEEDKKLDMAEEEDNFPFKHEPW